MQTIYRLKASELDNDFLEGLKAKLIQIAKFS